MPYERTGYAPWSLTREAGVQSATVDGTIQIPQYCQPTINTGFVDEKGNWQGVKSSDEVFIGLTKEEAVANSGTVLFPNTNNFPSIDMTGFSDMFIAVKLSNGGNCRVEAVMGPDTTPFANLSPVAAARPLRGNLFGQTMSEINNVLVDAAEDFQSDEWGILSIQNVLKNQKNMQFKLTNNTGGITNIEFGFMRLV
jgi:hypothetical protein